MCFQNPPIKTEQSEDRCPCLSNSSLALLPSAASSFSFCRASLEHTLSAEELSYQLPRRAGGSNLTWHDGRGQKTAHTRTVKLLQQPGTEGIQVQSTSV